jgi:RNA ligase
MNEIINQLIAEGYLSYKESDDGLLYLLNYTDKCTYEKKWIAETLDNRGAVYEKTTNRQIAFPFTKFFNYSELPIEEQIRVAQLSNEIDTVTEKIDGSLGILYWYKDRWRMNTRGSFNSEQSKKGLELFNEQYAYQKHFESDRFKGYIFLFEIIYPENRIVIDYKDQESLYLLSIFDENGKELDLEDIQIFAESIGCDYPTHFINLKTFDSIIQWQKSLDQTKEGCVVKMKDGTRYKFKSLKYLELAKLLNNLNPKTLWNQMKDGIVNKEFIKQIPEEFEVEINTIVYDLERSYQTLKDLILVVKQDLISKYKTNDINEICKQLGKDQSIEKQTKSILFPMFRDQDKKVDEMIWKAIEPKGDKKQ